MRERGADVPRCSSPAAGAGRTAGGVGQQRVFPGRPWTGRERSPQTGRQDRKRKKRGGTGPPGMAGGRTRGRLCRMRRDAAMEKAPTVARRRLTLPAWKGQTGN